MVIATFLPNKSVLSLYNNPMQCTLQYKTMWLAVISLVPKEGLRRGMLLAELAEG